MGAGQALLWVRMVQGWKSEIKLLETQKEELRIE
jgi:hypothetical protein